MITIKTKSEIDLMHESGKLLASCHREIGKMIKPGITTQEIETFVEAYLEKHGATSEQKGYNGYPYAICASVNDEMCHGFPADVPLNEGDVVTIDMVVNLNGALSDSAWTYIVGDVSDETKRLLLVAESALYKGIDQAIIGNHVGILVLQLKVMQMLKVFLLQEILRGMGLVKRFMKNQQFFILVNRDKDLSCKKAW